MSSRLSFHSQLSSIMETMAKSALSQVCKLVDEDSAELRLELSRLLFANSALAEKVNSLECELTIVKTDAPKLCKSYRSVAIQTVCHKDGDAHVAPPPTIEGIFGKDWCMDLWKDRDPYSLQRSSDSPQSTEKTVTTLPDQITVTEVKEEDYIEATLDREAVDGEIMAVEPEQMSVGFTVDGSSCSVSFDQDEEDLVSTDDTEEPPMPMVSISETEDAFSSHIIPIDDDEEEEEEEDDDEVQFVEESQQEPMVNSAVGPSHDKQNTLPSDITENSTTQQKNSQTPRRQRTDKFTCPICSRSFFHKGTLTHHMKSHKSNFCNICKQHFPHRNKLNSHNCVPRVPSNRIAKSCELCGKSFANPSALRIHYVVHTGEKPYSCSFCGKGFTQKGNLKCHLRIHTGERPFRCVKCGKTFTQKVNLNHHLMAHINREVGERPIPGRDLMTEVCQ